MAKESHSMSQPLMKEFRRLVRIKKVGVREMRSASDSDDSVHDGG